MSVLGSVIKGREAKPPRVVIYGPGGVGKSTWAAGAPSPIMLRTEDGAHSIDCDKLPLVASYADLIEQMTALVQEEHEYQTVILDSLDWLEPIIWTEVCNRANADSIEKVGGGYGKGYAIALDLWADVLAGFDAMRHHGMAIILIAHDAVMRYEDPAGDAYDRYSIKLHKGAAGRVFEWADVVAFAGYEVYTTTEESGFGKSRSRAIGNGKRVLRTCEKPAWRAKRRWNLPDELPLDWSAFESALKEAMR